MTLASNVKSGIMRIGFHHVYRIPIQFLNHMPLSCQPILRATANFHVFLHLEVSVSVLTTVFEICTKRS